MKKNSLAAIGAPWLRAGGGLEMRTVNMTPEMALELLERNVRNRNVRPKRVARYAEAMQLGQWKLTNTGIGIDRNGHVIDGQHRLHAVVAAGVAVTMNVFTGLDPESQDVIDDLAPRKVSDALRMAGMKNATWLQTVAKALILLDNGNESNLTAHRAKEALAEYSKGLEWYESKLKPKDMVPRSGYFGVAMVWLFENGWEEECDVFMDQLATMTNLPPGSPVITLHRGAMRYTGATRIASLEYTAGALYCMKAFVEGDSINRMVSSASGYDYFIKKLGRKPVCDEEEACTWRRGCPHRRAGNLKFCQLHQMLRSR